VTQPVDPMQVRRDAKAFTASVTALDSAINAVTITAATLTAHLEHNSGDSLQGGPLFKATEDALVLLVAGRDQLVSALQLGSRAG